MVRKKGFKKALSAADLSYPWRLFYIAVVLARQAVDK
jgi:hypothetical protein